MADALVSAILQQLTTIIQQEVEQEVKLVTGMGKKFKRLKNNLESIRALLNDAEERQIKDESIKIWLKRLKEVCYEMEDVLDEWNTALLKSQLDEADQRNFYLFKGKVCRHFLSCFSCGQVVQRRDIAIKIKEINERLDEIAKDKDSFQLTSMDVRQARRVESTAFTEVTKLYGRDEVKKRLKDSLLCGNSDDGEHDVKTISVIGMGGIGKTALAQLVYNDKEIETHFNKKIWVWVSEVFDLSKVAKAVIMGLKDPNDHVSALELDSFTQQTLLERICKDIEKKKVFLVLDDVWTDESKCWESLNQALNLAAPGSRILVTTRNDTVVKTMNSFPVFPLEELSEDVCWKILSQEAFVGRGEEQCKNLEHIGREIVKKCSGLPLAAKALGSMLRFKKTREEWTNILNSEIWKLKLEDVFAPLLLSYFDLPSAERRCFLYCSTFRKGVKIERDVLIYQWMAQGYLNSSENPEMEITGVQYFESLAARSFFQDLEKLEDGSITACKIHDIVLNFARFLMGNEFLLKKVPFDDNKLSSETHHLLVLPAENACIPTSLVGAEKLRSLSNFASCYAEKDETGNLFIQPKHLRSLIFCAVNSNRLAEEVGKLMHLRLLNLSGSSLQILPEAICQLCNLQSLLLRSCPFLQRLPGKIEKLVSLRYLDTTDSYSLTHYPKGIGRLTSLRNLLGIVVICDRNHNEKFSLGDLENLCHLRSLSLIVEGDQIDANEARRAKLQSKINLKDLKLTGPWRMMEPGDGIKVLNVIKVLNAPSHTKVEVTSLALELTRKVQAHAQAIRAAYLFKLAGEGSSSVGERSSSAGDETI